MAAKAAIAWLLKEDWQRWQAIDAELPPYDQWLTKINQAISEVERKGMTTEKVPVDPDVFSDWCKSTGKPINRNTRSEYAATALMCRSAH
jgi:hypothetical protein